MVGSSGGQALGDLELQAAGFETVGSQRFADAFVQSGLGDLGARQVHRQHPRRARAQLPPPLCKLAAGLVEHALAQRHDESGLFGHFDEFDGRDEAAHRVLPAHQGLDARDLGHAARLAGVELNDGLVDDEQLVLGQGLSKFALEAGAALRAGLHAGFEDAVASAAVALGFAHGQAGVLQHRLGIQGGVWTHHHAHADTAVDGHCADAVGLVQCIHQPLGHGGRELAGLQAFEHDDELVDAQARSHQPAMRRHAQCVALTQRAVDAGGH